MQQQHTYPSFDFLMLQLKLKGFWQRRGLGQHFLIDPELIKQIAGFSASVSNPAETLAVEIGPGPGTLTTALAEQMGGVLAIELDTRLKPLHQDAFGTIPKVGFFYGDALRLNLWDTAKSFMKRQVLNRAVLTGNLPFQITSPLLFRQCDPQTPWDLMVFMIQKEVADRICASPGNRDYGVLSIKLSYWWQIKTRLNVPSNLFFPRPQVDASVLIFERRSQQDCPSAEEWIRISPLIESAFSQRRKMLTNSLTARWNQCPDKDRLSQWLELIGARPQDRAENLSPDQFRMLANLAFQE